MPGFDTGSTMYALNVDFTGNSLYSGRPTVTVDGQLLIGSTALPNIQVGNLTSPDGSITIGYSSPNITLQATGSALLRKVGVDTTTGAGTNPVVPDGTGLITYTGGQYATGAFGTRVLTINSPAANTVDVEVQISTTNSTSLITKNGVCHFDSTSFAVDANGFVTLSGAGFKWNDISGAFSPLKDNGYFITGTATGTLPAAPAQGDTIEFFVDHASQLLTIKAPGTQLIRLGSLVSSAGGTAVSSLQGDSVELVYRSSDTCWCAVGGFSGTWTMA